MSFCSVSDEQVPNWTSSSGNIGIVDFSTNNGGQNFLDAKDGDFSISLYEEQGKFVYQVVELEAGMQYELKIWMYSTGEGFFRVGGEIVNFEGTDTWDQWSPQWESVSHEFTATEEMAYGVIIGFGKSSDNSCGSFCGAILDHVILIKV
jgi:hypothetical protein